MRFHITHTHEPRDCIAHKPDEIKRVVKGMMAGADAAGVKVVSMHVAIPAHTLYLIVDADSNEQLDAMMDTGLEWGRATITPVGDLMAAVTARIEE